MNKPINQFRQIAAEYCRLIDSLQQGKSDDFYLKMQRVLASLAYAILDVENVTHEDAQDRVIFDDNQDSLRKVIEAALSHEIQSLTSYYREMNISKKLSAEKLFHEDMMRGLRFSDDLADIYRALKMGLAYWEKGTANALAQAAWEWRWNYEYHWSEHLFFAMMTVNAILYWANSEDIEANEEQAEE